MVPRLGVNIDHVATVRQARGAKYPDPVAAAALCEIAGADSITVHLREDRRHIQDRDVKILKNTLGTMLNLEMAATAEMVKIALYVKPHQATLVPEKRQELTTEGGLNLAGGIDHIAKTVHMLEEGGVKVSLFIDPDYDNIKIAHKLGVDAIELHTGAYCDAVKDDVREMNFAKLAASAKSAHKLGLQVNAGHGITYLNIKELATIPEIEEYNIGHAIIAHAIFVGLDRAVKEMIDLIRRYSAKPEKEQRSTKKQ